MKKSAVLKVLLLLLGFVFPSIASTRCQRWRGRRQRNIWGDFLENPNCSGPDGQTYPRAMINAMVERMTGPSVRSGRSLFDPYETQDKLLRAYAKANGHEGDTRKPRNYFGNCSGADSADRLCSTEYNTTVPMYGISLTTGEPVTIVQKFPNLLQQVVFEECLTDQCSVIRGHCVQTYVPQLFFVVPMGPVTLMGQDYVLVESGCVCSPRESN